MLFFIIPVMFFEHSMGTPGTKVRLQTPRRFACPAPPRCCMTRSCMRCVTRVGKDVAQKPEKNM